MSCVLHRQMLRFCADRKKTFKKNNNLATKKISLEHLCCWCDTHFSDMIGVKLVLLWRVTVRGCVGFTQSLRVWRVRATRACSCCLYGRFNANVLPCDLRDATGPTLHTRSPLGWGHVSSKRPASVFALADNKCVEQLFWRLTGDTCVNQSRQPFRIIRTWTRGMLGGNTSNTRELQALV